MHEFQQALATLATDAPDGDAGEPSPSSASGGDNASNDARQKPVRTIRLQDGTFAELFHGWNEIPGGRVYLRRDGGMSFKLDPEASPPEELASAEVTRATAPVGERYRWETFGPGNTAALKHGAKSPAKVDPIAAELVSTTLAAAPFLAEPSFRPALEAWARSEARCLLLERYLDEHGLLDADGTPRPATALMTQQENLALKHRTRLGLDAASRAGIEASLTTTAVGMVSLEAAMEAGTAAIRARFGDGGIPGAPQDARNEPPGSDGAQGGDSAAGSGRGALDGTGAGL